jgi:thiol-disulfide isomerase/thioredoxin
LRFATGGGSLLSMRMLATAALICVLGAPATAAPPEEVAVGQPLRNATMRGLNTPARQLSEFRGRPLLINVWASWCGPCRAEMASLERLAWLDDAQYFTIIGVSTDDYVDKAQAALTAWNSTITHFIDTNLELEKMLGANTLPLTVLVSADGRVLGKVHGAQEWDSRASLDYIQKTFGRAPRASAPGSR